MFRHFLLLTISLNSFFSFAEDKICAGVCTVPSLDLNRYLGSWHEVASIPQRFQKKCVKNIQASYSLNDNGNLNVLNTCEKLDGSILDAKGQAKIVDTQSNAKLKVTFVKLGFWIWPFGGDYWVLGLGNEENYGFAVVGHPNREYAWILSRSPMMSQDSINEAKKILEANNYNTCLLLTSVQEGGNFKERKPLCEI